MESSGRDDLIEIYLVGTSVHHVEGIAKVLQGSKVSASYSH